MIASAMTVLLAMLLAGCGHKRVKFESIEDFKTTPSKVGVYVGSTAESVLTKDYPLVEQVYIYSVGDMVLNLKQGNIDSFVMDRPTINYLKKEYPELTIIDTPLTDSSFGAALSDSFGNSEKAEQFNEFLRRIKIDGTEEEMKELWFAGDSNDVRVVPFSELPDINGVVSVAAATENIPYVMLSNSKITGYEIDIIYRFCKEYGYAMKCESLSWGAMISGTTAGDYDIGVGNNMLSEQRDGNMIFSEPEGSYEIIFVTIGDDEAGNQSTDILKRFKKTVLNEDRWKLILAGIGKTLLITVGAVICGTILGFILFMLCRKKNRFWCRFADFFSWLIDGFPIVVLLMFGYYIIFANFDINALVVCIMTFSLTFASGCLGMLRSSVGSIDEGQMRAALGLGFRERRAFFRIILPQAVCIMKPAYISLIAQTLKGTAIVGYITVEDLTRSVDLIRSITFDALFPIIISAIIYFLLAWLLGALVKPLLELFDKRRRSQAQIRKEVGDE